MTAKALLGQALENYTDLTTLLGVDDDGNSRIYQSWHESSRGYPQITITRINEFGVSHGDNGTIVKAVPMQVDVWVSASYSSSPTAVELEVKNAILEMPEASRSVPRVIDDNFDTLDKVYRITIQTTIYN